MDWNIYTRISALMFLEFAVWGAWMPVLALRLLGPLKMTGKQTGWIYATFPLACIFSPFVSGYLADKWFNAEWIILV
jgi:MFS family permease